MQTVDKIPVKPLVCTRCDVKMAWVETFEGEKAPTECWNCDGRMAPLRGAEAVEICFKESEAWHASAERTLDSVKGQLRYSAALKREARAQQNVGGACV